MSLTKTLINNSTLVDIMTNIFSDNDYTIAIKNSESAKAESISVVEYLNTTFYCFQNDQTATSFYGMAEEDQVNYINAIIKQKKKALALCEVSNISLLASEDIDGGNFEGQITFFIPTDRIQVLDTYLSTLRNKYIGTYESGVNASGQETAIMLKIGDLHVSDMAFQSQIGRANVCTLTIEFGYMLKALNYTSEKLSFSTDGETYEQAPFSKATIAVLGNPTSNTIQNQPMAVGDVINSISMTMTITYYEFNAFSILGTLRQRMLYLPSEENKTNLDGNMNADLYVKYSVGEDEEYTYRMIVKDYTKNIINTDFSTTTLSLTLKALE